MRNALRGFFSLSVLLLLMGVLPGTAASQGNGGGSSCGTQPDDAAEAKA